MKMMLIRRSLRQRHTFALQPVQRCFSRQSIEGGGITVDDGYSKGAYDEGGYLYYWRQSQSKNSMWAQFLSKIFPPPTPGTLILVRHGESQWNREKKFTGWCDVDLTPQGKREIEHAARLLLERGYTVDVTYTSLLKRAIRSAWILNREIHQIYRPVVKSWRLNERMYGALEGCVKPALAMELGEEVVQKWRRGLEDRPPAMTHEHVHWHENDRKYAHLVGQKLIPVSESLQDTLDRTMPLWANEIKPDLQAGRNVLIVAHANSLRGIVKHIDGLNIEQIEKVGIPNGIPLVYKFDSNMRPMPQPKAVPPLTGEYLEKQGLLRAALEREAHYYERVQGYETLLRILNHNSDFSPYSGNGDTNNSETVPLSRLSAAESHPLVGPKSSHIQINKILASLTRLSRDRDLMNDAITSSNSSVMIGIDSQEGDASSGSGDGIVSTDGHGGSKGTGLGLAPAGTQTTGPGLEEKEDRPRATMDDLQLLQQPLLIIIRHGKTEHNKLGLFTGWEDAPLALEGRNEAIFAGKLMKVHGLQFDVVYTSWLSRAIETALSVIDELDSLWVPLIKTWRLNERMYGALTGLSKKMIRQRHGPEQFLKWRRGFDTKPPKVSSFSQFYPGNDDRYVNYVQDVPISVFESMIRSLAHGHLELHKQFPKTESLKDCMERTIPYFKQTIVPHSIEQHKNVLISSSENAIRGLLMHLCDIPIDQIHQVEIPTGLPLVYDKRTRRIRLLDDGLPGSPMDRYDFGTSPGLLLRPRNKRITQKPVRNNYNTNNPDHVLNHDEEDELDEEGAYYDPVIRMSDPSLLTPLALVHPYRHKSTNHTAWSPTVTGEGVSSGTTIGSGLGAGLELGAGSFEEEENMKRKQREAFSVPDV